MENNVLLPVGESSGISRRQFLVGSGAVVGAAALFGATGLTQGQLLGVQLAHAAQLNSDMDILQFALTLEHLEDVAYRVVNGSGLLSGDVASYFKKFGESEHAHVLALTDVIKQLGGNPVAEQSSYNLPKISSQDEAVKLFATVEEVGAGAYLGAAPLLQDKNLLAAAAAIHNVEAQHASALKAVMGVAEPAPAFASPLAYNDVIAAVTPFLQMTSPGMPTTGNGAPNPLAPLGIVAGLFAAAFGVALKVRSRNDNQAEQAADEVAPSS